MKNIVTVRGYEEPEINHKEIFRYAGCRDADEMSKAVVEECLDELGGRLTYKVCFTELSCDNEYVKKWLNESRALNKNLSGCGSVVLFAATIGLELDRLIARYSRITPVKALFFQAIGAERIEALCNAFNRDVSSGFSEKGLFTRPRFSPGYGDFPLCAQKDIFSILDCPRKIGVMLNDSLLMSPSKSVTAIIGVSDTNTGCTRGGCESCGKTDCGFRR